MKGLERIRVSVVVGGSSWVCRDVDHSDSISERTMEPSVLQVWACVSWNCRDSEQRKKRTVCWLASLPLSSTRNRLAMVYAMVVLPELA
jgi:hypothetical protein